VIFYLFLILVLVPLVELFLLLKLAEVTSPAVSLGVVILTGVVGTLLARSQGFRTLRRARAELAGGRMPAAALIDAVMIFLAGALLVSPGILTDLLGISLLVPACRRFYRRKATDWFRRNVTIYTTRTGTGQAPFPQSKVIDSYVVEPKGDEDDEIR
jgi:UPF0716 protein FxsA